MVIRFCFSIQARALRSFYITCLAAALPEPRQWRRLARRSTTHSCEKHTCSWLRSKWGRMRSPAICSGRSRWHRGNMSLLRWIWAYLFDCVHSHTTWPHQNQSAHAYVCCLDCSREMKYSLEYMRIVRQNRKQNIWGSRSATTAALIMAGALLLLSPNYAVAET